MAQARGVRFPRRLLVASLLLGVFVLFDLGLLGWLIFRSLSQREIERVLLETRTEAEELAGQIAGGAAQSGDDLYTLIAKERETQTYIDAILKSRDIVKNIEIRDAENRLVFRAQAETFLPPRDESAPPIEAGGEVTPRVEEVTRENRYDWDMEVPIGELGVLQIGISQVELGKRIGVLRRELVRQTGVIAAVTLALLLLAYVVIAWLWRRGRRLEELAAEAERMAYIGTLASGLAHEIRNPLNSLSLNIQMLEEESSRRWMGSSSGKLLSITREEIARLERLVTHFLLYAKPRPLELETVAAGDLLERCRDLLQREFATRGVALEVERPAATAWVRVDAEQIAQLLVNLAQNALAAVESGSRPPRVVLRARVRGERVVFEVEDNGDGVPPEEQEKIFDLFYSTRKGGTGLGLAVVRRIASAHGGEVALDPAPGGGTCARVSLERAERPEAARGDARAGAGAR